MRKREEMRDKSERKQKVKRNKIKYFGLQLCYSTVIHLGWHCNTIENLFIYLFIIIIFFFLQLQDFTRLGNVLFLCLNAKIYQHMTYRGPNVNALNIGNVQKIELQSIHVVCQIGMGTFNKTSQ